MSLSDFESDRFPTSAGDLQISFLGHGSLLLCFQEKYIYIDIFGKVADYSTLPKANYIVCTHDHFDHLDPESIKKVSNSGTQLLYTEACSRQYPGGIVLKNGDVRHLPEFSIEAVPAYNIVHHRENGEPFHPKGEGNGYIITIGGVRVYIAGDTENVPEMQAIRNIDIAFLPMNLPYTMTPEMVATAARVIQPRILYPYHFGSTDTTQLVDLLVNDPAIEVRIRKLS